MTFYKLIHIRPTQQTDDDAFRSWLSVNCTGLKNVFTHMVPVPALYSLRREVAVGSIKFPMLY